MARTKSNKYYAIYRGDEMIAHGYSLDLAVLFNVEEKSIREMAHKTHYERVAKAPNPDKRMIAVKVEELTKDDLIVKHRKK